MNKSFIVSVINTALYGFGRHRTAVWVAAIGTRGFNTFAEGVVGGNDAYVITFDNEQHKLTVETFMQGFRAYIAEKGLSTDEIDGVAADAILQFALFGKVMYG